MVRLIVLHHPNETVKQISNILRPRTGFRVTLEAERGYVGTADALQGAIEQRHMGGTQGIRQGSHIHREAVVLAGNDDALAVQILHRMIGPMVAELHLHGARAGRERQQLMTKTNPEGGDARRSDLLDGADGVIARLRVARSVGE